MPTVGLQNMRVSSIHEQQLCQPTYHFVCNPHKTCCLVSSTSLGGFSHASLSSPCLVYSSLLVFVTDVVVVGVVDDGEEGVERAVLRPAGGPVPRGRLQPRAPRHLHVRVTGLSVSLFLFLLYDDDDDPDDDHVYGSGESRGPAQGHS